jgi:DNA-binding MarR family transcriptional regulator
MSKLIDGLVSRKLVNRTAHSSDRRRMCLSLTAQGREELKASFRHTEKYLAEILSGLTEEELKTISHAMQVLRGLFLHEREDELVLKTER